MHFSAMHVNNAALSTQVIRAGLVTGLKTACSWMSDMWCRVVWYTEIASSIFRVEEEFFLSGFHRKPLLYMNEF
jgi:hypothetical protein